MPEIHDDAGQERAALAAKQTSVAGGFNRRKPVQAVDADSLEIPLKMQGFSTVDCVTFWPCAVTRPRTPAFGR